MPYDAPGLRVEVSGPAGAAAVVLAHGFTQNAAAWGPFGAALARDRRVVAVDLPGHGGSGHRHADLWAAGRLLGQAGGVADYLGYSLGGRVALHLALERPGRVRRLTLIGATAGLDDKTERAARRAADETRAIELDALAQAGDPVAFDAWLHAWLAGPLFTTLPPAAAELEARRRNAPAGLAASLRACGLGRQAPLWDRLGELAMPTLIVVGERDERFGALGERMAAGIGANARLERVPGAGHACHLERPAETAAVVQRFLDERAG